MYGELYQYLILHKELHLPGIGTFSYEKKPAYIDITEKLVHPPAYSILFGLDQAIPPKGFFSWLGAKLNISERDAVRRFNEFLYDLKNQLSAGSELYWSGIGTLSKGLSGETTFEADTITSVDEPAVPAVKVLRENAEHTVRVGEQEKTSHEMRELLLNNEEGKKSWWWITALILIILAIIYVGYYFSTNGLSTSAAGNQQELVPQESK